MGTDERRDSFDTPAQVVFIMFLAVLTSYVFAIVLHSGYEFLRRNVLPLEFGLYISALLGLSLGIAGGYAVRCLISNIEDAILLAEQRINSVATDSEQSPRPLAVSLTETLTRQFIGGVFFSLFAITLIVVVIQNVELIVVGAVFGSLLGVLSPFPKLFLQRIGLVLLVVLGGFAAVNGVAALSFRISSVIVRFWFDLPVVPGVYVGTIVLGFVSYILIVPSVFAPRQQ